MKIHQWFFVGCMISLLPSIALAAEGRIPISGPTTIAQSGSYLVTQDVVVASGSAITITANNVSTWEGSPLRLLLPAGPPSSLQITLTALPS